MGARIKEAMLARGLEPADLIRAKVLSKAGIYLLLNDTTTPDKVRSSTVAKLAKALGVNGQWITTGRLPRESNLTVQPDALTPASQASELGRLSHLARIVPEILVDAGEVHVLIETMEGKIIPKAVSEQRSALLREVAELYNLAIEDGGKVSHQRLASLMEAAMSRRAQSEERHHDGRSTAAHKRGGGNTPSRP